MKNGRRCAAIGLSLALVLFSYCPQAAEAATFVGGTAVWTFVGTPNVETIGFSQAAAVTLMNHLDVSVLGIVVIVLHNGLGQTVYYSTATLNITRGMYGTAYAVVAGVQPGAYSATIFALSTGGVAISNSTTIAFPAH